MNKNSTAIKLTGLEQMTKETIMAYIANNTTDLVATHARLSLPIIYRMYRKMSAGIRFPPRKVAGCLICDGHHRYLASLLASFPLERIPGMSTSATIAVDWDSVCFEETDWDSPTQIKLLNAQDAEYNNIDMEEMIALL